MFIYSVTIILSSFLLFLVQPMLARHIAPWFGGGTHAWISSLLFFQLMLVAGYLYAHAMSSFLSHRTAIRLHLAMIAISMFALPVIPAFSPGSSFSGQTVAEILLLLLKTVGLPYFILAATSPLLQRWFWCKSGNELPYRLFAVSNAGAIVALLAYPTVIEPRAGLLSQERIWSAMYICLAMLVGYLAWDVRNNANSESTVEEGNISFRPRIWEMALWILFPACGSIFLACVTSIINETFSMPLLWILPLCLYLLTFCLAFGKRPWYARKIFLPVFVIAGVTMLHFIGAAENIGNAGKRTILFSLGLFICCMVTHGELAQLKPSPRFLTLYYFLISIGGAAGGFFAAAVAPRLYSDYSELNLALVLTAYAVAIVAIRSGTTLAYRTTTGCIAIFISLFGIFEQSVFKKIGERHERNIYGRLVVKDVMGKEGTTLRQLIHGRVNHGQQHQDPAMNNFPSTYYGPDSGVGMAIHSTSANRRIGVIGLGVGTMAAYGRQDDNFRFYEINPLVAKIANEDFTFLANNPAKADIVLGDARISLGKEPPQDFDILVVDAFSGDSIPVHLITMEALQLYFRHLRQGGVLAIHISNLYLDLEPVIQKELAALGKMGITVDADSTRGEQINSRWILAGDSLPYLRPPTEKTVIRRMRSDNRLEPWTDDYANLLSIFGGS